MSNQTCKCMDLNIIRNQFIIEAIKYENHYHEIDIYRICTDDWTIDRYLLVNKDQQNAYNALLEAIQWKKKFGVHQRTNDYFMREVYEWGDPELCGQDKLGRYIVWHNIRHHNPSIFNEFENLAKLMLAHMHENYDKIVHKRGLTIIRWLENSQIMNFVKIKMNLIRFDKEVLNYYPLMIRYHLLVNMPKAHAIMAKWLFSIYNKTTKGINQDIKMILIDQLTEYVDWKFVPVEMGGPRWSNIIIPANAKPLNELIHFKFSEKALYKFYNYHDEIMLKMTELKKNRENKTGELLYT